MTYRIAANQGKWKVKRMNVCGYKLERICLDLKSRQFPLL